MGMPTVRMLAIAALFLAACVPAEEDIPCETAYDCPEGWECGPEYVCIESGGTTDTNGVNDNSLPETDTTVADADEGAVTGEDMTDQTDQSLPDEDTADIDGAPVADGDAVTGDDAVVPDEDSADIDDAPVIDEDTVVADDAAEPDEDTMVADDVALPDDDIDADAAIVEKTKIIGTDTSFTNLMPFSPSTNYRYSAAIYPKAQVSTTPITITRLAWQSSTTGTSGVTGDIKILMKVTTDTTIPSQVAYTTIKTDATEVFSGTLTGTQGWNEKVLDTPFSFAGTQNLMVLTEFTCTPAITRYWYFSGTSSNTTHAWYGTSDPASGNGINLEGMPNLRVTYY